MIYDRAIEAFEKLYKEINTKIIIQNVSTSYEDCTPVNDEYLSRTRALVSVHYNDETKKVLELQEIKNHSGYGEVLIRLSRFIQNTILIELRELKARAADTTSDTKKLLETALQKIEDLESQVEGSRNRSGVFEKKYNDLLQDVKNTSTDSKIVELNSEIQNLNFQISTKDTTIEKSNYEVEQLNERVKELTNSNAFKDEGNRKLSDLLASRPKPEDIKYIKVFNNLLLFGGLVLMDYIVFLENPEINWQIGLTLQAIAVLGFILVRYKKAHTYVSTATNLITIAVVFSPIFVGLLSSLVKPLHNNIPNPSDTIVTRMHRDTLHNTIKQ